MREILFRGKRIDNGEWVMGMPCSDLKGGVDSIQSNIGGGIFDVIPETVGQYTGLKDKNGKRIFEGDIVRATITSDMGYVDYTKSDIGIVGYDNIGVIGIIKYYDNDVPVWSDIIHELSLSSAVVDYSFEVIGNIHDNSKLLEDT